GNLRYARDYAAKRREVAQAASLRAEEAGRMSRLYVIESTPTITGANADHRFSVKPSGIAALRGLESAGVISEWDVIVRDLQAHTGASIVIAGDEQPPEVH